MLPRKGRGSGIAILVVLIFLFVRRRRWFPRIPILRRELGILSGPAFLLFGDGSDSANLPPLDRLDAFLQLSIIDVRAFPFGRLQMGGVSISWNPSSISSDSLVVVGSAHRMMLISSAVTRKRPSTSVKG